MLTVNPSYTDQLVDYVQAADQLEKIKKERKRSLTSQLLTGAGTAAAIGAGSGYLKGTLLGATPTGPLAWTAAGTLGALAAGSTAAMILGRRALRKRLEERAQKTIGTSDPSVIYAAKHPATAEAVREYAQTDWMPYYGGEIGLLGGLLGGLGTSWALGYHGQDKPFPTGMALGTSLAGAGIGAAIGVWLKNKKKREMAKAIEDRLADARSSLAQEAVTNIEVEKAEEPMIKAAGPMPRYDNSKLLRNRSVERYASGPFCAKKVGSLVQEVLAQLEDEQLRKTAEAVELMLLVQKTAEVLEMTLAKTDTLPKAAPPQPVSPTTQDTVAAASDDMKNVAEEATKPDQEKQAAAVDPARAKLPYRKRVEVFAVKDGQIYGGTYDDGSFGAFGGGLDDDDLVAAAEREFAEETGLKAKNIRPVAGEVVRVDWNPPYKSDKQAERAKSYRGSETYFAIADLDDSEQQAKAKGEAGKSPLKNRKLYAYAEALQLLDNAKPVAGLDADELANMRAARRRVIASLQPQTKTADVATLLPRRDVLYFTPTGKLALKRGQNRRFDLPTDITTAAPVPYERPIRLVPAAGIPDADAHGYEVQLASAEGDLPKGYEEVDPQEALKELYASMGMPANAEYQALDRARARALLRLLKKRQRVVPAA